MTAPATRVEAQRRADEIRIFQAELARLEADGVLELAPAQREAVTAHHDGLLQAFARTFDVDRDSRARQLSLGMRVASFLGALALAASVFFLFYQFWGHFEPRTQVAILVTAALGTFAAAVGLDRLDATGYFTKLAAMVAFACFVLNVSMLGQIYDITPSDRALLPWAALALLLAYLCDLRLLLVAGILSLVAFVAARTGTWSGMYWIHFGQRPENFFPAAVLLLGAAWVPHRRHPDFPPVYRVFGLLVLFLPVLVLANWGDGSYATADVTLIERAYQTFGFVGTACFMWLGARRGWSEMTNTALVLFVVFLYTKFYDWWWDVMPKYLFFLVVALTAILFLLVMRRLRGAGAGRAAA